MIGWETQEQAYRVACLLVKNYGRRAKVWKQDGLWWVRFTNKADVKVLYGG